MLSGEEIKSILKEVSHKTDYQDADYLYNLGYRNPVVCGDKMVDLLELLELYAKARTKEMKSTLALSIEAVLANWTYCFVKISNTDWPRNGWAV